MAEVWRHCVKLGGLAPLPEPLRENVRRQSLCDEETVNEETITVHVVQGGCALINQRLCMENEDLLRLQVDSAMVALRKAK